MGCHGSKQARRDLRRSPSPLSRSRSLPEKDHVVSLTSSTLGSLSLDIAREEEKQSNGDDKNRVLCPELAKAARVRFEKQSNGDDKNRVLCLEARVWSGRRIPRTPTETPPNEPEPIDALELMHGLHGDYSPFDRRSFSFYPIGHFDQREKETEQQGTEEQSSKNNAVVLYYTTLRGVRKTFDDCCTVKAILREYGVRVDERDVSMHGRFRDELRGESGGGVGDCTLPRVFVDGKELGGVEQVKRLHEKGGLAKLLEGCALEEGDACDACGEIRFVVCAICSGSCRVYVEDDDEEEDGGGWQRCSKCNENGIVRCPVCCSETGEV